MLVYRVPQWLRLLFPKLEWEGNTEGQRIYLTFDDGPIPGVTDWVLDTLEKYDARATFFCVGENVQRHPDIYERIAQKGHAVGNHTFHHVKGWSTDTVAYSEEVARTATMVRSDLFRPPYGRISRSQVLALRPSYRIIMWSLLSGDYESGLNRERSLRKLMQHTRPGSIVVFHDSEKARANLEWLLPRYLEFCAARGYIFATL